MSRDVGREIRNHTGTSRAMAMRDERQRNPMTDQSAPREQTDWLGETIRLLATRISRADFGTLHELYQASLAAAPSPQTPVPRATDEAVAWLVTLGDGDKAACVTAEDRDYIIGCSASGGTYDPLYAAPRTMAAQPAAQGGWATDMANGVLDACARGGYLSPRTPSAPAAQPAARDPFDVAVSRYQQLPEGWSIRIDIDSIEVTMTMTDANDNDVEICHDHCRSTAESLTRAIDAAIAAQADGSDHA